MYSTFRDYIEWIVRKFWFIVFVIQRVGKATVPFRQRISKKDSLLLRRMWC